MRVVVMPKTEGETILESLEAMGVEHEYQCRSGYCGACRTKASGAVDYVLEPVALINAGEILPCCCTAKGAVLIDIDEQNLTEALSGIIFFKKQA